MTPVKNKNKKLPFAFRKFVRSIKIFLIVTIKHISTKILITIIQNDGYIKMKYFYVVVEIVALPFCISIKILDLILHRQNVNPMSSLWNHIFTVIVLGYFDK